MQKKWIERYDEMNLDDDLWKIIYKKHPFKLQKMLKS